MKRVMIIGFSGSGKSTLARRIAELLGCEPTHMDKLHWLPNWAERSNDEEVELLSPILKREKWVIDGNYSKVLFEGRMFLADTIIFLDFNRFLCFWRIIKRRIMYNASTRPDMTEGCAEKLDFEFLKWVLSDGRKNRDKYYEDLQMIREQMPDKKIYILKRPNEVKQFLSEIERNDL